MFWLQHRCSFWRGLGLGLGLGHVKRWARGRGRPPGVTIDRTPHHYDSPVRATDPVVAPRSVRAYHSSARSRSGAHELGLLLFGSLLVVALYVIAALGQKSKIPDNIGAFLGIVLGLALIAHMANRWLAPDANAVILPLAALLNGIGYVVIARWDPGPRRRAQAGLGRPRRGAYVLTLLVVRYSRDLERYRYLLLLLAGLLLVAPLVLLPHRRRPAVGALRQHSFQPVEFSKILLCIFFASYFAENKETAHHPDGPDRQPPLPRSPAPAADPGRLGRRHGHHRPRGRHRLCRAALRPLHRLALGRHGTASATWSSAWSSSASAPTSRRTTSARSTSGSSSGRTRGRRRPNPATRPAGQALVQHGHRRRRGDRTRLRPLSPATSPN